MPNIMITKRCNLSCPYCFANKFVNNTAEGDMPLDVLEKVLEFVLRDGSVRKVGLIGGEPSCHRRFRDILELLAAEERLKQITLYTNGILLDDYFTKMENEKFKILINCNEPQHIGRNWIKFVETLKRIKDSSWKEHVTLGVNFYAPDFDYTYMLELVEIFAPETLRVSVSVPNHSGYAYDPFSYFITMKPRILSFFQELKMCNVIPFFDCNVFPACLVSADEVRQFDEWGIRNPFLQLKNHATGCKPVIDIMDDMTAVRCFGLSEYTRVSIEQFASFTDLMNYYLRYVDAYAVNTYYHSKCADCYQYKVMRCSGGCLVYKIDQIQESRKMMGDRNGFCRL